jgi:integrase
MASIEARGNAVTPTWRVVWREHGQKQWDTFATEAKAIAFKRLVDAADNHWPFGWVKGYGFTTATDTTTGPTLRVWAEKAITARFRAGARTKADYRRDMKNHVYPHLGDLPIAAIGELDIGRWLTLLIESGMAPKTIQNIHGTVSSIMNDAMAQRPPLVDHNPFAGRLGELPDVRTEEMVFLTQAEFRSIVRWMSDPYSSLARLLAGTGLRYGEATALSVRSVDLLDRRPALNVVRAWKRLPDSTYMLGEPKTPRARRTLSLSAELVDLLLPLVAGKRGDELVIQSVNGHQLLNSTFHDVGWEPAVARARVCETHLLQQRRRNGKLPRVPESCQCDGVLDKEPRIHDIRHSHVSWLIADGHPLAAISRRLGHNSITTTVDRYGHRVPDMDDAINASIDQLLAPV